jgi:4a-hydroxytetrahydrobiopterin dehydratase
MANTLVTKHCHDGAPKLDASTTRLLAAEVPEWNVAGERLAREFKFPDFASALAFVNRVGEVAESENHHPDIALTWGKVAISTWTHSANGLSENDFVLAAKIDALG